MRPQCWKFVEAHTVQELDLAVLVVCPLVLTVHIATLGTHPQQDGSNKNKNNNPFLLVMNPPLPDNETSHVVLERCFILGAWGVYD